MVLYLIGLGLGNEKDITLRGLEAIKKCSKVYLESYTSLLQCKKEELEKLYGKKIIPANREKAEQRSNEIIQLAKTEEIALLIVGDPFAATTHIALILEAREKNVPVKVIHNASILTAIGETGLELYKFGKTTTVPLDNAHVKVPIDVIAQNKKIGLHTLVLFDITPKKMMHAGEAAEYLIREGISKKERVVICSSLGSDHQEILYCTLEKAMQKKYSLYPQCMILPGKLHFIEEESLKQWE